MMVLFDLDGTLACCEHRQHHVREFDLDCGHAGKIDWDAFYAACVDDKPLYAAINTLIAFQNAGAEIQIWTGRSDIVRVETMKWLARYGVGAHLLKRMRPHGNHEPDTTLKMRWLDELILRENRKPDLVLEDRARVVRMWRDNGIPCFQVQDGEF